MLSKESKFCSATKRCYLNLKSDLRDLTQKLKCREKIWGIKFEDNSLLKNNTLYTPTNPGQELNNIINSTENTKPVKQVNENNLSKEEWNTLTQKTNNPNIVI